MRRTSLTIALLAAFVAGAAARGSAQGFRLPKQGEVFAVRADLCAGNGAYFSSTEFFSALPTLTPIAEVPIPGTRHPAFQQGVLVTTDKRVFFLAAYSRGYVTLIEAGSNVSQSYRLPRTPRPLKNAPGAVHSGWANELPKPADVFLVATYPWNTGTAFTADSLLAALPRFVPGEIPPDETRGGDALNGIIVLNDRRILQWYTRNPSWLTLGCRPLSAEDRIRGFSTKLMGFLLR